MEFYAPGKLLLTSEYVVLAGAQAFAVPTTFGQWLSVHKNNENNLITWKSLDHNGSVWFEASFTSDGIEVVQTSDPSVANRLSQLLVFIRDHSDKLNTPLAFETRLNFDRNWGLGSSSSLVACLAKWSQVEPIDLLHTAFKGSGYDVAVGMSNSPIVYQLKDSPDWHTQTWNPPFRNETFFVYLGEKQNSESEVRKFNPDSITTSEVEAFSLITHKLLCCSNIGELGALINEHERLLSKILKRPTVAQTRFPDYPKPIKSLGAWGGDFVWVAGTSEDRQYFSEKGYPTILTWDEMVAPSPDSQLK